jgi:putative methyltransferase (TIGR04325 family)
MKWTINVRRLKRLVLPSKFGWSGDFSNWKSAQELSTGYDASNILEKVRNATLKVKNGEAAFERDSVTFDHHEYSWPLLSALMWVAAVNKGILHVLDFGGSLGSTYFQNKRFLDSLEWVSWSIVEQPSFVDCGRENMQDKKLRFYYTAEECVAERKTPDLLLLSCCLPYLEKPYEILKQLLELRIPYLVIDNTYFNYRNRDRICLQRVPPSIYKASYPCWFLDYNEVKSAIGSQYSIISEHDNDTSIELDGRKVQYKGLLAQLKINS